VVFVLVLAMLWHCQMAGNYFMSKERGIILDFLPPFAHAGVDGDFYIKPPYVVYTIWSIYLMIALLLPAVCAWLFVRLYERDLKRAW
jgi:hypothetical protein